MTDDPSGGPMILPLLLLLQNPASSATDRPIRVWMDAAGPVSRGTSVRLYIQAGSAGNLVVLHSRTDGKIEVLFPARPTDDPHVSPGTWEVRGKGDGPIWTVNEPDGSGMILAALTPDPVWFDEFSHEVSWNPDALMPSWDGADPAGGMQDIVQRMLGDGGFTYDVLNYTVAPEAVAQAPGMDQGPQTFQNPDDTFPTIDNTLPEATKVCDGSNPYVYCSYFNEPRFFGGRHGRRRARSSPVPALPTPANPQGVASMVLPLHPAPAPASAGPVVPRRRMIPDVAVRSRAPGLSAPAPAPAPASGVVRTLASHPVTGAELGRLGGASPAARSTLVLRYVHPPRPERLAPAGETAAVAPASMAPPVERATATTVAASMPIRARGTMLMSRTVSPSAAGGVARSVPLRATAPSVAARPTTGPAAPRTGGTVGGWMVMPRRR